MNLVTQALISNVVTKAAKKDRKGLEPGKYEVDEEITLRVKGTVKVGVDGTKTPTHRIPMLETLALFMRYSGVTGGSALKALEKAMAEALSMDKEAREAIAEVADLKAAEKAVRATLEALPKTPRKGSVTVSGSVTVVPDEGDGTDSGQDEAPVIAPVTPATEPPVISR